jgi:hypothetical protein
MPTLKEKIDQGFDLEETVIDFIISEMKKAAALNDLEVAKKDKITALMQVLIDDSREHQQILRELSEKY